MQREELKNQIRIIDKVAEQECRRRWDAIAKPLHSLGRLEDALVKIAGITGDSVMHLEKKALVIMCADNGVVEEGVTQTGPEVTAIVSENFLTEAATASVMCRHVGADVYPVDIGIRTDTKIINRKIAYGTKNMLKEPAMTTDEVRKAIEVGMDMVRELKEKGYGIIATGEMGIGNTTTSSAVTAVLLDKTVEEVTGRGAGLTSAGLNRKITVIKESIAARRPDASDAVDVLSKVGGLDIAGLTGVFIGGAVYGVPILVDGFISAASALAASMICPEAKHFMMASHVSKEPAMKMLLEALELKASITCEMCLGEGTGAAAYFPLLDLASAVYRGMTTFEDNQIEQYQPLN